MMKSLKDLDKEFHLCVGDVVEHIDGSLYKIEEEKGELVARGVAEPRTSRQRVSTSFMNSWSLLRRKKTFTIEEFL